MNRTQFHLSLKAFRNTFCLSLTDTELKKLIQTNKKKKEIFNRKTPPQEETRLIIKKSASSISC